MELNRKNSLLLITLIYILTIIFAVGVYLVLPFKFWLNLLIADIATTMFVFVFSVIFKNASIYDPYWSVQPIVVLFAFLVCNPISPIKICLMLTVVFWGVRLTANWVYTFKDLQHQDWRYTQLKQQTKKFYPLVNFFGIHLFPTLIVYSCILPAVFVMTSNTTTSVISYLFILVSILSVILQGVADWQMHQFRKNRVTTFMQQGVWKYSRHPNYLAEILMWWGIGLSCVLTLNAQWYLLVGAMLNTLMFIFISIPLADKRLSKKEGFKEYKNSTRMLLPIPRFNKNK